MLFSNVSRTLLCHQSRAFVTDHSISSLSSASGHCHGDHMKIIRLCNMLRSLITLTYDMLVLRPLITLVPRLTLGLRVNSIVCSCLDVCSCLVAYSYSLQKYCSAIRLQIEQLIMTPIIANYEYQHPVAMWTCDGNCKHYRTRSVQEAARSAARELGYRDLKYSGRSLRLL